MQDELQEQEEAGRGGSWALAGRVLVKAALLFVLLNLLFALFVTPDGIGRLSLYNLLLPGRMRLPYGENPAESYNLTLNNLPAMFASHSLSQPKQEDEFRVIVIGDSGTWGWLLENDETLAGQINAGDYVSADGRQVVAYNMGYPVLSLTKDLLLLDEAMAYEPDLVIWPVTLDSFVYEQQLTHPLLQNNSGKVRELIAQFGINLDADDPRFVETSLLARTIVGQRRPLADLLRLQAYGFSWAATGIDQYIPDEFPLRKSDFEPDESWQTFAEPATLTTAGLAFDVLAAGIASAGDTPVLLVNEPIYVSSGENSALRYNSFYPRWAFDQYRELLAGEAAQRGWNYLDLWDAIPPDEFTDTPVHITPAGTAEYARLIGRTLFEKASDGRNE